MPYKPNSVNSSDTFLTWRTAFNSLLGKSVTTVYSAAVPTINDDQTDYENSTIWIHTTPNPNEGYLLLDNAEGAAVWLKLGNDGSVPLTGNWDVGAYTIQATQFISDISIGTPPLVVTSTTKVTNLNSDLLDDQTGAHYLARANHTGTQSSATITGLGALAALGTVATAQIDNDAVNNTKLANMAAWTIKLRNSAASGDPSDTNISGLTLAAVSDPAGWLLHELSTGELLRISPASVGTFQADGSADMTGEFRTDVGTFDSDVANSGSAVAFSYDTAAPYNTPGAKLANWKNNNVEKAYISKDGAVVAGDGTAAAPSVVCSSDLDTGFYSGGSNKISFASAGANRFNFGSTIEATAAGSNLEGAGLGTNQGWLRGISNKTTGATLTAADSGRVITNLGASGHTTFTLPSAAAGLEFSFVANTASWDIVIVPGTGDQIFWTKYMNWLQEFPEVEIISSSENLQSDERYSSLTLVAVDSTTWVVTFRLGIWISG